MAHLHEKQEGMMKKLQENVNIVESTKNAMENCSKVEHNSETEQKAETDVAVQKSSCGATVQNRHSDHTSAPQVMPVLKKKMEDLSQAESTASNLQKLDEMGRSLEKDGLLQKKRTN